MFLQYAGLLQSRRSSPFGLNQASPCSGETGICDTSYDISHMKYGISAFENDFATALLQYGMYLRSCRRSERSFNYRFFLAQLPQAFITGWHC